MIETLREFVQAVLLTLAVLCVVAVVVFYSVGAGLDRHSQRESQYRAACEEAKGKVVWNGRHWECLK